MKRASNSTAASGTEVGLYLELMEEREDLGPDLASLVHIVEEKVIDCDRQAVKVNDGVQFDAGPVK